MSAQEEDAVVEAVAEAIELCETHSSELYARAAILAYQKATAGVRDADMPDSIKEDGKSGKWWLKQVNHRAGQDSPQGVGNAAALQRYIDYLERTARARDEAIEECAKEAERWDRNMGGDDGRSIAFYIRKLKRALKSPPPGEKK